MLPKFLRCSQARKATFFISLRSWRYCEIKVLAGSIVRVISLDYITTAPPPNVTRLLHNTASYAGYFFIFARAGKKNRSARHHRECSQRPFVTPITLEVLISAPCRALDLQSIIRFLFCQIQSISHKLSNNPIRLARS